MTGRFRRFPRLAREEGSAPALPRRARDSPTADLVAAMDASENTYQTPIADGERPLSRRPTADGRCWARTSDLQLVELALSLLS